MRSRRNVTLVFGARGHLGQSGCEDPVESLESCLYHARLASRRTTQSSIGGDPEGHPCRHHSCQFLNMQHRAYTVSYFKHETSSRISYLEIYLSSPNGEAGETRLGLQQGRRGSATQKRAARLHTRARLTHGCTRARVGFPEGGARRFGSRGGSSVGPLRARLRLPDFGRRGGCWWSGYRGFARRRLPTGVSAALASDRSGATRLADGLAADARRRLRLGFGVRETAAPTDARLRRSAWTILLARLEARRRLGCDCGSAALLNREGCLAARVRGG
ncbi:hypothetical protein E6C27_scaffold190G00990 [Cucumis melo var. makuwa]|nr:hypothetical protein E6C27_scaffold190G00990 [Cucumis melo var. makuwa]